MRRETLTRDSLPRYTPEPIETGHIALPPDLVRLAEHLARNAHEVWARQRLSDGWTRGPRNDGAKHNPWLVPFDELPEREKAYDRAVVDATMRAILAMGYQIVAPSANERAEIDGLDTIPLRAQIQASSRARELIDIWHSVAAAKWGGRPELCAVLARRFIQLGEPLLAREVLRDVCVAHPDDLRLRHLNGLALARSGAMALARNEAESITRTLGRELGDAAPQLYEDAYGLLGRASKDLALSQRDETRRRRFLADALAAYEQAFAATGGSYSAINAAAVALVLGDREHSRTLASAARDAVMASMDAPLTDADRFWQFATLGEAALLHGDTEQAAGHYEQAAQRSQSIGLGDIANTRRQARLIASCLDLATDWLEVVLPSPAVVAFVGGDVAPADEATARAALRAQLSGLNARVGYSGAIPGSDVLFQEVMREIGGSTYVVLPYAGADAAEISPESSDAGKDSWRVRVRAVLDAATECLVATEHRSIDERLLVDYQRELLVGLATIHARRIDGRVAPLIPKPRPSARSSASARTRSGARIACVMFSDVIGFSRLGDAQVESFVREFLGLVGRIAHSTTHRPMFSNTWGDGLYFQFMEVEAGGLFALELHDAIRSADWSRHGLPSLSLRTGLHAGPLFAYADPVTGRRCLWGRHVTRAARIEPVTPPGEVYASEAFAALSAAQAVRGFECEPVGRVSLAKAYGAMRLYHVRRTGVHELRDP